MCDVTNTELHESDEHPNVLRGTVHRACGHARLHGYFEEAARFNASTAKQTGLYCDDEFLSYDMLNRRATIAAEVLQRRLATNERGAVVAVDMEPCNELIVVLLAILKIGAAYLPVDSHSAINRVRYILNEVEPLCILVDFKSVFNTDTDTVWSRFCVINIDDLLRKSAECSSRTRSISDPGQSAGVQPAFCSDQAVVIYTSGSTGRPKGVKLSHRAVMNRLAWQWRTFPFDVDEVGCFKTSPLFVDSIVEIFSCVLRLVSLVVVKQDVVANPEAFVDLLAERRVTRLTMVPSLLRNIVSYLGVSGDGGGACRLRRLRLWVSNSETLQPSLVHRFFAVFPTGKRIINLYGSTETTADVTFEEFSSEAQIDEKTRDNHLSIGRPMHNCNVYLLDDDLRLLDARGSVGEICVSGLNVADGYIGDQLGDSTSNFIANPFSEDSDHRVLYRTGDFGRIVDGHVVYEGRTDVQVKIRGQRVNISEIERVVGSCAGVDKVTVLCHRFSQTSNIIVAYYTALAAAGPARLEDRLADACRHSLPAYMRPKLLYLAEMPVQAHSGKVRGKDLFRLNTRTRTCV